jgi:hypothetical protein
MNPLIEKDAESAWEVEILRRVEEIRSGRASGKPSEQVFVELEAIWVAAVSHQSRKPHHWHGRRPE